MRAAIVLMKKEARSRVRTPYAPTLEWTTTWAVALGATLTRTPLKNLKGEVLSGYSTGIEGIGTNLALYTAHRPYQLRAAKLAKRYARFKLWMTEGRHKWTPTGEGTSWADNSVEIVEVSQLTGERRTVQTVAPHGDLCF